MPNHPEIIAPQPRPARDSLPPPRAATARRIYVDAPAKLERLLSLADVMALTSYSKRSIYRHVDAGTFPAPMKLSGAIGGRGRIAWREGDVGRWLASRSRAA
jgi:prophage regulatory protein